MNIDYIKISPTGNITLLVRTPVPRERQAETAAALLRQVGGEQVGYIERSVGTDARLQMMGGEFCGNATMALCALLARERDVEGATNFVVEVSGSNAPVPCTIERDGDNWIGTVRMPLPKRVREIRLQTDGETLVTPLVEMPGIAHLILPLGLGASQMRRRLPEWNEKIGADALGALAWNAAASSIDPLVYVPSTGTLVREHGCGSGSAAVGCWLSERGCTNVRLDIHQPGGVITVAARRNGPILASLTITGRISILEEGSAVV